MPSLIRVFAVRSIGSQGPKVSSCGLIWVFAVRTCHFVGFVIRRLKLVLTYTASFSWHWRLTVTPTPWPSSWLCGTTAGTKATETPENKANNIWTASSEFGTYSLCEQRRFRRACASAQSRQNLCCSLIEAVNQEEPSDRKPDPWPLWMAGHAQLKFVMTECSKTQIRLTGLIWPASVMFCRHRQTWYSLIITPLNLLSKFSFLREFCVLARNL